MRSLTNPFLLTLLISSTVVAQESAEGAFPSPKTEHHEAFANLAGHWRTEVHMRAMPGVPGMEKAGTSVGHEHAELICDGLWLKVSATGEMNGQHSSGVWMLGYDPIAKEYQTIVVSSMDGPSCEMAASFDAKTATWHFDGDTPMGPLRSTFVQDGKDRTVETCYTTGPNGKEVEFMEIVRTRVAAPSGDEVAVAAATDAAAGASELPKAVEALHAGVGSWTADFKMEMPGAPAMKSDCREVVSVICGGKWTWSDFTGQMFGMPFEGHALTGYDASTDKVVSYWVDSMNGPMMRTEGSFDPKTEQFTMTGVSYDELGRKAPVASSSSVTGDGMRQLRMVFGKGETASVMTIDYRRAK